MYFVLMSTVELLQSVVHGMAGLIRNGLIQQLPVLIIHVHVHLSDTSLHCLMFTVRQSRQLVHYEPVCQPQSVINI